MEFITSFLLMLHVCAVLIQVLPSLCAPRGTRRFGFMIPDPSAGVECPREPNQGEYCDKFSSGQIKWCSPCNIDQLRNPHISFPEECANLLCPYRCPEEISDRHSPAPRDSCDLTTASLTTLDTTTDVPTTYSHGTTSSLSTQRAFYPTTSRIESTITADTPGNSAMPRIEIVVIVLVIIFTVIGMGILAYCCVLKKHRCKKAITSTCITSPSTEPMMASNEGMELSPLQTPVTPVPPVIVAGDTSVEITTQEPDQFVRLACACGGDEPIPISPKGAKVEDLLPSTGYDIHVGTYNDNTFVPKHREAIETSAGNPDVCVFSLHELKNHIESNSSDFVELSRLFSLISADRDLAMLRRLSRVLGVFSLSDVVGAGLFEEVIKLDVQRRSEEDSCSVYSVLRALVPSSQNTQFPDFVADICRKLSSIHEDCLACRHLVCQVSRNSSETTV